MKSLDYKDDRIATRCRVLLLLREVTSVGEVVDTVTLHELLADGSVTRNQVSAAITNLRRQGYLEIVGRKEENNLYLYKTTEKVYEFEVHPSSARYPSHRERKGGYKIQRDPDVQEKFDEIV